MAAVGVNEIRTLVGKATREIGYLRYSAQYVDKLRNEVEELKDMSDRVVQNIHLARSQGKIIRSDVLEWTDSAFSKISEAQHFLVQESNAKKTCFNLRLCVNFSTLYRYGKTANYMAYSLSIHKRDGQSFITVLPYIEFYQEINLVDSQNFTLIEMIKAIKHDCIQIIGIFGRGGVGKTTLVMEVAARVKNQFSSVVYISVSRRVNSERIKKDVEVAINQILKGEKILIIFDDLWEALNLHKLGIPCGIDHMNCKILLTSRRLAVCHAMGARNMIYVDSLTEPETWHLFKRVVGERVETDQNLKEIGMRIIRECGGLPLLIQAVGNALKGTDTSFWKSALDQLQHRDRVDITNDGFTLLELSYELLKNQEAKSCFLLCSLFPEDAHIPLERLTHYAVGARKLDELYSIEVARSRVQRAVNTLKSSFLVLNTDSKCTTKMHGLVRDAALLIATKGTNKFLVKSGKGLTEWFPSKDSAESYTGISLMQNNIHKLPRYRLHLPLLDTLLVQENRTLSLIPDVFIRGIINAKVLDMENNNISYLPPSLKLLTQLRYLNLGGNKSLKDISILGELLALEILILNDTGIKEVPEEIGQLVHLRLLEAKRCLNLSRIARDVILRLRLLEECHIGYYGKNSYKSSLQELNCLQHLTFLYLFVQDFEFIISQDFLFHKLKGFVIQIGGTEFISHTPQILQSERRLIIETASIPLFPNIKLVKVSHIHLQSTENLNNLLPTLSYEGFAETKSISLSSCNNVSCLVDTTDWDLVQTVKSSSEKLFLKVEHVSLRNLITLKVLWNCPHEFITFSNLATLKISGCRKLRSLFPVSVAQELVNLRILDITFCDSLESVIWEDEIVYDTHITLRCLASITLVSLGQLKCFSSVHLTIKYPCLESLSVGYCSSMKIWGNGVHDIPKINFQHEGASYSPNDIMHICSKANQLMTFTALSTSSM